MQYNWNMEEQLKVYIARMQYNWNMEEQLKGLWLNKDFL